MKGRRRKKKKRKREGMKKTEKKGGNQKTWSRLRKGEKEDTAVSSAGTRQKGDWDDKTKVLGYVSPHGRAVCEAGNKNQKKNRKEIQEAVKRKRTRVDMKLTKEGSWDCEEKQREKVGGTTKRT